jgi:hypothetical protein
VNIHQLYIDYKEAYDCINRDQSIDFIKEFGIPNTLVRLVKITFEKRKNKVNTQTKMSPSFETAVGLKQGDAVCTILFDLCMEKVIKNVKTNPRGTVIQQKSVSYMQTMW